MLKFAASLALSTALLAVPVSASIAGQKISNDLSKCRSGNGPAVLVNLSGVKSSSGKIRVQLYRGTKAEWLKKGAWINRIETPAKANAMAICVPVPSSGTYGIAVRHDMNSNGKTDISKDGGGMSNNPSINIFNLGKPGYEKTAFPVGNEVKSINIEIKYL
ncbi:MAG: DUF2141 domain-containing protein [Parasphingorhabdus sp.]|uniref:DUF2141 domain-containing protein n=1 Tax=Parasphingorhabdus sp. TaxID=2709688 RepID=UPI003001569E